MYSALYLASPLEASRVSKCIPCRTLDPPRNPFFLSCACLCATPSHLVAGAGTSAPPQVFYQLHCQDRAQTWTISPFPHPLPLSHHSSHLDGTSLLAWHLAPGSLQTIQVLPSLKPLCWLPFALRKQNANLLRSASLSDLALLPSVPAAAPPFFVS